MLSIEQQITQFEKQLLALPEGTSASLDIHGLTPQQIPQGYVKYSCAFVKRLAPEDAAHFRDVNLFCRI